MHVDSPETRNKFFERVDSEYKRVCKESSYGRVYADDDRFTIPLSLPSVGEGAGSGVREDKGGR